MKVSRLLIWIALFSVSMGYLESAVVVYLRAIYYPEGFAFPLRTLDPGIATTEVIREAATLVMLISIAVMTFRRTISRFAAFIFAFAIWDISYYLFLWLLIGWPSSLLTWDILFLIPVTWVGPVLAPLINSAIMIILAILLIRSKSRNDRFRMTFLNWLFLVLGSVIIILAYTLPYMQYLLSKYAFSALLHMSRDRELLEYSSRFIPRDFNWILFLAGVTLTVVPVFRIIIRMRRK